MINLEFIVQEDHNNAIRNIINTKDHEVSNSYWGWFSSSITQDEGHVLAGFYGDVISVYHHSHHIFSWLKGVWIRNCGRYQKKRYGGTVSGPTPLKLRLNEWTNITWSEGWHTNTVMLHWLGFSGPKMQGVHSFGSWEGSTRGHIQVARLHQSRVEGRGLEKLD